MLFSLIFRVSFDQHVFFQFYYKTVISSKIAKFKFVHLKINMYIYHQKAYKKQHI